jgi:cytochrome c55X
MRRAVLLILMSTALPALAEPDTMRQAQLINLLRQDCGACHGMTLKGGLGPSLLPEALSGKPPEFLRQTILDGRAGTPMPPWRGLLSADEVDWLVYQLRNGVVDAK